MPRYETRCLPPPVLAPALALFNELKHSVIESKLDIPLANLSPEAQSQISLPHRLAGLAFKDPTEIAPAAYIASVACAMPFLNFNNLLVPTQQMQDLMICLDDVRNRVDIPEDVLPVSLLRFSQHFSDPKVNPTGLQHALVHALQTKRFDDTFRAADVKTRARLKACAAPGASRIFTAVPDSAETRCTDPAYLCRVRLHVGLPIYPDLDVDRCACGEPLTPDHLLACKLGTGAEGNTRHDAHSGQISKFCDSAGLHYAKTPLVSPVSLDCPDLEVFFPGKRTCYTDSTIVHPLAASYCEHSANTRLFAAERAATIKHTHYDDDVKRLGGVVHALAMETFGGITKEHSAFLSMLAAQTADHDPHLAQAAVRANFTAVLAVLIAEFNWRVVKAGALRIRRAHRRRVLGRASAAPTVGGLRDCVPASVNTNARATLHNNRSGRRRRSSFAPLTRRDRAADSERRDSVASI